jgi:hypothetical protein
VAFYPPRPVLLRPGPRRTPVSITNQQRSEELVTTDDLLEFWRLTKGNTVHPADEPYLKSPRGLDLTLIPQPWAGPLATADIFVLHLNPGLDGAERDYEQANPAFRQALIGTLEGRSRYLFLDPRFAEHPGHGWALDTLGRDVTFDDTDRICMVQAVPYHSKTGADAYRVAHKLASTTIMRRWVTSTLLQRAIAGEVSVVIARAATLYGLANTLENPNLVIYRFPEVRRARVTSSTRGGVLLRRRLSVPTGQVLT